MERTVLPAAVVAGETQVLVMVVQVSLRKETTVARETRLRAQAVVEVLAQ